MPTKIIKNIFRVIPFLFFPFILVSCGGGGGSSSGNSSGSVSTVLIWQNNIVGCVPGYNLPCTPQSNPPNSTGHFTVASNGAFGLPTPTVVDTVTGDLPSAYMYLGAGCTTCMVDMYRGSAVDMSAYQNGHLQFDLEIANPALISSITMTLYTGITYSIPFGTLTPGQFVHMSIPLTSLYGPTGLVSTDHMFNLYVTPSGSAVANDVFLYVNDIKWTSN